MSNPNMQKKKFNGRFSNYPAQNPNFSKWNNPNNKQVEFEDISTASSNKDQDSLDTESRYLDGFSITVCGEAVVQENFVEPKDDDIKMFKFAMAKQLCLPRQDDLPQPTFLID